jgi:DNA-binding transcriptional MerR regulator
LIRIGVFARLSQLSIPTLHHYDEIGLLKPISVDSANGYRYYSVSQLPRLNRILALKDLGFSLEQIEQVLEGDLPIEELRGMLKLKRAEVERQMAEAQAQFARIEARLKQIEMENAMPAYEVVLKTTSLMLIASCTVTIPTNDQVPQYLGEAYSNVYDTIKAQGVKDTGPCFALWHQGPEILANEVAEAAVPIERKMPSTEKVKVYELPPTQVASTVHHGDFENFTQAHTALLQWTEANGYRVVGPYREIYIQHNHERMNDSATEVQYPVEKV